MLKAVKVRLYPTTEQQENLAKSFGCARWYWNYALNACTQHYEQTGKSLKLSVYKAYLPKLKVEHPWLKEDCYSAVLQCVAINLNKAYTNFFVRAACPKGLGRTKFPRFKAKHHKQSIQYPQNLTHPPAVKTTRALIFYKKPGGNRSPASLVLSQSVVFQADDRASLTNDY